jgi:hypothetical protein
MLKQSRAQLHMGDLSESPVVKVQVGLLLGSDSPRLSGEDRKHVRELAEVEDRLPPIIVHRESMRVIDGMHRLGAAALRGELVVDVRFFDGDAASSFVLAVEANIQHGLPLSRADRKAAASRIISSYPQWSDRLIASVTGIAARTVAAIRRCPTGDVHQLDSRIGRDGRVRHLDGAARRTTATRLMAENPGASLREIGREAGISPETVRGVRARLRSSDSHARTEPDRNHAGALQASRARPPAGQAAPGRSLRHRAKPALSALMVDPALRSTDAGRALLRMLAMSALTEQHRQRLVDGVPAHCLVTVAQTARACCELWRDLAERLEQRSQLGS